MFRFTKKDARGNEIPLDEQEIIIELQSGVQSEADLANRFQIILPLAREINIR